MFNARLTARFPAFFGVFAAAFFFGGVFIGVEIRSVSSVTRRAYGIISLSLMSDSRR
jgi:hypothetical protein